MTTKTILFSVAMTLGGAACYQDPPTNTPANTYAAANHKQLRRTGVYNASLNVSPAVIGGTDVNTDSDMSRTGNSGTTKEGNPGTAYPARH
jgi:hypothetical protein